MNKPASLNHPRASAAAIACLSLRVSAWSSAAPVRAGQSVKVAAVMTNTIFHCRSHHGGRRNGSVSQDNQCAYPPLSNQKLLAVAQAHVGIDAADKAHRGKQAIETHGSASRALHTCIAWCLAVIQTVTERGATLQLRAGERQRRRSKEHEVAWVESAAPQPMSQASNR